MDIEELLELTVKSGASDLHLSSGMPPIIRVDGDLRFLSDIDVLYETVLLRMLDKIIPTHDKEYLRDKLEMDFAIGVDGGSRFRVNVFRQARGISAAFRVLPKDIPSFKDLGFPDIFYKLCGLPHGLVLVTGPTGSGKTTTIASLINHINKTQQGHILTIEDPIEYIYAPEKCLIQQREVRQHTATFSDALRAALREDPDYILVGEMRDLETVRLALTAAETGHLVFATLHTNSAAESIDRILDVFPSTEKNMVRSILAGSLQAVVSQILVKKKGGGRVAAQEVMICTTAIRNLIREDKIPQIYSAIQTGLDKGMRTLVQHLQELADNGLISEDSKVAL